MKKLIAICVAGILLSGAGCTLLSDDQKRELDAQIKDGIIKALNDKNQKRAEDIVDTLVKEGILSESAAEKVKAALPVGIEKVKEVLSKEVKK